MIETLHPQAPLALASNAGPSFANFLAGANQLAVDMLTAPAAAAEQQVYLWGGHSSGKTHLLLASHQAALSQGLRSFYVSLDGPTASVAVCESLDGFALVGLDNIDAVAAQPDWERALFNLINEVRQSGTRLLVASGGPPSSSGWRLPDLVSRLGWGPVIQLHRLDEQECIVALQQGAEAYGMQLEASVARYLLQRHSRDVGVLLALIPLLDRESLAAGRRRITIPFLRRCLAID